MIPLEIITGLGSVILAGVMKILGMRAESRKLELQILAGKHNHLMESRQKAAEFGRLPGVQWTRRFLAIFTTVAVIGIPMIAAFLGIPTVIGYTEFHPGFLFIEGAEVVRWESMIGLVITPLHTHLLTMVFGLYFGGSLVGHNR